MENMTANSKRESILKKFRSEIDVASYDNHDIESAYEEVIEKFEKEFPDMGDAFQYEFVKMNEEHYEAACFGKLD